MTLKDLLYVMKGDATYVCTDNNSFPKEHRHLCIHYATLFVNIVKSGNQKLLDTEIITLSVFESTLMIILKKEEE